MHHLKSTLFTLLILLLSFLHTKADEFSVVGQAYYLDLTSLNISNQEFNINIATTPSEEREIKYLITLSPGKRGVPTNILVHVYLIRNNAEIMNFDCKPEKTKDKTVFHFSIKANYAEESIGQIYYGTKKEDGTPGHSVVYRFRLNDFIKRANPLLKKNPDE